MLLHFLEIIVTDSCDPHSENAVLTHIPSQASWTSYPTSFARRFVQVLVMQFSTGARYYQR